MSNKYWERGGKCRIFGEERDVLGRDQHGRDLERLKHVPAEELQRLRTEDCIAKKGDEGPYDITPNTVELIPTLGALPPQGGPVQDPVPQGGFCIVCV